MSGRIALVVSWSLTLVLGAGVFFLFSELGAERDRVEELSERESTLAAELADLEASLGDLRARLDAERERGRRLAERRKRSDADAKDASGAEARPAAAAAEDAVDVAATMAREPYVLESLEGAAELANGFLDRGDVEGLWLLCADLLAMGEPGYDKLVELFGLVEDKRMETLMRGLWRDEEMLAGPFIKAATAHAGEIVDFMLHVESLDQASLPKPLQHLSKEVLDDELGGIILGFYDGADPGVYDRFAKSLGRRLEAKPGDRDLIRNLSQIPTDLASELVASSWDRANKRTRMSIAQALAWQRTSRSLPLLREILPRVTDAEVRAIVEAAIRYVE